jgi:SOS-response transcriptional repressor LexA
MSSVTHIDTASEGAYYVVRLAIPGRPVRNAGIILVDPRGELHFKFRDEWDGLDASDEDLEFLSHLQQDFESHSRSIGPEAFLHELEDRFSNLIVAGDREKVRVVGITRTIERLFGEHVEPVPVQPYRTHLPLYTLRAAATKFGEDMEVGEQDWIRVPGIRLNEKMFVATVVGRSMEPRIPDGSLCVFRYGVVGSRQGKILLVERAGVMDSSARYTIKRYTSTKVADEAGGWRHDAIVLEPLNPEFESFPLHEGDRVIAEFIQVLE